jgi:ferredoxin-NADP reductase
MLWKWHDATVITVQQLSKTTRQFTLAVDNIEDFDFLAGQFITFDLPISQKRLQRWRSYSIASAPNGTNIIELCIARLEGGIATRYFFEDVFVGSVLKFKGADGAFVLPKTIETDITMICTGTGIAPFRAMLHHIFRQNIPHKKLHLIFGTRFAADILYLNEWRELEKQYPEFSFSAALSQQAIEPFFQGYVHAIYTQKLAENSPTNYFICGWKAMIDEARERLAAANIVAANIHYELYG